MFSEETLCKEVFFVLKGAALVSGESDNALDRVFGKKSEQKISSGHVLGEDGLKPHVPIP